MLVRRHYIFEGRVQGVGFRIIAYQKAQSLKLTGWIRNMSNGHVEACFQGEESQIQSLITYMQSIRYICITHIEYQNLEVLANEKTFQMKY